MSIPSSSRTPAGRRGAQSPNFKNQFLPALKYLNEAQSSDECPET